MIIEFTMKNTRPLADKTPITCCGDFRDEKHWEAFKRVEALRGWRVHESEKVNLVETPNIHDTKIVWEMYKKIEETEKKMMDDLKKDG